MLINSLNFKIFSPKMLANPLKSTSIMCEFKKLILSKTFKIINKKPFCVSLSFPQSSLGKSRAGPVFPG
ncbi:MAG: hypothetical protein A3B72_07490 [Omnitrophica bacterium RIFCSPHIGHO2_02_FULL_45_28]|nr:MAG: hypothetical protein A3B72_07490 [Omnitrophica bacterium RIFCSPHIGHO2_02_FULL_45_28]